VAVGDLCGRPLWRPGLTATYRDGVDHKTHEEIVAATAAHRELGPGYDDAVAEGLVERIGAEVDRRVDARLARHDLPARRPARVSPSGTLFGLGSMAIGGITAVSIINTHDPRAAVVVILIWIVIGVINVAHALANRR
jgi:hypothetical protein